MPPLPARSPLLQLPAGVVRGHIPETAVERLPSGNPALDGLLNGGFPRGGLSEITGPPSSGRTSLLYEVLASATARGEVAALVDPGDRFDPVRADASGIRLARLLWVRPRTTVEALRACDILLATRGFAAVTLDLADGMVRVRASLAVWLRLARHAAGSRAALVVLGRERQAEGAAHLCLTLSAPRPLWPKHRLRPPLFGGIQAHAEVVRARQSTAGTHRRLTFENP